MKSKPLPIPRTLALLLAADSSCPAARARDLYGAARLPVERIRWKVQEQGNLPCGRPYTRWTAEKGDVSAFADSDKRWHVYFKSQPVCDGTAQDEKGAKQTAARAMRLIAAAVRLSSRS